MLVGLNVGLCSGGGGKCPAFYQEQSFPGSSLGGDPSLPQVESSVSESNFPLLKGSVEGSQAQHLCLGEGKVQMWGTASLGFHGEAKGPGSE